MIKPPVKEFTKTNHKLSFLLGIVFTVLAGTFISALVMWVLKINPQDILLELEEIEATPISQDQEEGINISAINFSDQDYYLGNKDAKKVFVFYTGLKSVHANRLYQNLKTLVQQNPGQIKIVWRHWPTPLNTAGNIMAVASECAGQQNKFWEYIDQGYELQKEYIPDLSYYLAREVDLDIDVFEECIKSSEVSALVEEQVAEGIEAGISGTPNMIYINQEDNTYKYIGGYVSLDYLESLIQ